jgi:kojibiose phosphorylase
MVVFDWDGTAVKDRQEDTAALRSTLERLSLRGTPVAIVTGTSFANIHRQLTAGMAPRGKSRLYVLTNRGSESYGFDAAGHPSLLWRREATPAENLQLDRAAELVRQALRARAGLDAPIIWDRLNRRKIDLIPLAEWQDPPKAAIAELRLAVEERWRQAGLAGVLGEAVAAAARISESLGLADARITSDVKHVEIGLTDKADAVDWALRHVARPRGIRPEDVLIGGDEFGSIGGQVGSDSRMMTAATRGAMFVSVGIEPEGVPPGVLHLPGGPPRWRAVLTSLLEAGVSPTTDPTWLLVEEGFTPSREHEIEALFTTANGYVGTRGSLAEGSRASLPATFVAGIFGIDDRPGSTPELAVQPDWSALRIVVNGRALSLEEPGSLAHRRILDLRQGIAWREWRHRDAVGRVTRLCFLRLASLADRHALLQRMELTPENFSGHVAVSVEPTAAAHAPLAEGSTRAIACVQDDGALLAHVCGSPNVVAMALATRVSDAGASNSQAKTLEVEIGKTYSLEQAASVYTSRDGVAPLEAARRPLARLTSAHFDDMLQAHVTAWRERLHDASVEVSGDAEAQRALRFAVHHLVCAANPDDAAVSVGARGLTGEAYRGHVFWDTEIHMLPFYIYTHPPSARSLLLYRHRSLPAARERARSIGCEGALFAWESTDDGRDTTPRLIIGPDGSLLRVLTGELEQHISADVAYGVWLYWHASGDDDFLLEAGAEILLETARFWASRVEAGDDGLYHIRRVIGPDEYHVGVDDNAYTNRLARWNLEQGAAVWARLARDWPQRQSSLASALAIRSDEPARWLAVARDMYSGLNPRTGIFEQFRGYDRLESIDVSHFAARGLPLEALLAEERLQAAKIIKQADVVMLLHLLWDELAPSVRRANFDHYLPQTAHGSSLSPAIHAAVAARLGLPETADRLFHQTAAIDLGRTGNAAGGVHMAALGGLWQAAVLGFAGLSPLSSVLRMSPKLPPHWKELRFRLHWRGRRLAVMASAEAKALDVRLEEGAPLPLGVAEAAPVTLSEGQHFEAHMQNER